MSTHLPYESSVFFSDIRFHFFILPCLDFKVNCKKYTNLSSMGHDKNVKDFKWIEKRRIDWMKGGSKRKIDSPIDKKKLKEKIKTIKNM